MKNELLSQPLKTNKNEVIEKDSKVNSFITQKSSFLRKFAGSLKRKIFQFFIKSTNFFTFFFAKLRFNLFVYNSKYFTFFFYTILICLFSKIPIFGIDYKGLSKIIAASQNNGLLQTLLSYASFSPYDNFSLNFLSLGILPYVNGSLFIDLLIKNVSPLEKFLKDEGPSSKEKIKLYKKLISLIFSLFYIFLIYSVIKNYFYIKTLSYLIFFILQLLSGSLVLIWISDKIDSLSIVNGVSFLLCLNLFKNLKTLVSDTIDIRLILLILFFGFLVYSQQNGKFSINVISSRQLYFFENLKKINKVFVNSGKVEYFDSISDSRIFSQNKVYIRTNPGGIYPLIIASSILAFLSSIIPKFLKEIILAKYISIFYGIYFFILIFSCFSYSYLYFDPTKIREEFTKNSIYIRGFDPGEETEKYLVNIALINSLISGIYLSIILLLFQFSKLLSINEVNNLLNLSSLIIFVGVISEIKINLSFSKTTIEKVKNYESTFINKKDLSKLPIN